MFTKFPVPPPHAPIIRVTERAQFRNCRRRWAYAYKERLQPKNAEPDARSLGTAVHAALATYYRALTEYNGMALDVAINLAWSSWATSSADLESEQIELGTQLLQGYFKFAVCADEGYMPVLVEQTLYAKIPGTKVWLQGTMDLIAKNHRGLWIFDHKTYRTFLTPEQVEFDDQLLTYIWLCHQNGIPVKGAYYNMIRKKVPTRPLLLKNGTISRNKAIDTDAETYRQAVTEAGLDVQDYADFLAELPEGEFFKRLPIMRSHRTIASLGEDLIHEAREMSSKNTPLYPNRTRECAWCDFTHLCRTQTDRGDVESVKESLYSVQDKPSPIRRES